MTQVNENAQGGLQDRSIEDLELEEAIEEMKDLEESAKEHRKARKKVKQRLESYEFEPDTRVRVGRFVVEMKERVGHGTEIPPYRKTVVGKISEL